MTSRGTTKPICALQDEHNLIPIQWVQRVCLIMSNIFHHTGKFVITNIVEVDLVAHGCIVSVWFGVVKCVETIPSTPLCNKLCDCEIVIDPWIIGFLSHLLSQKKAQFTTNIITLFAHGAEIVLKSLKMSGPFHFLFVRVVIIEVHCFTPQRE